MYFNMFIVALIVVILYIHECSSWQNVYSSDIETMMARQLNDMSMDYYGENFNRRRVDPPPVNHDITLTHLGLQLNRTVGDQNMFFARAMSNGNLYALAGNELHLIKVYNDHMQLISIASISDINGASQFSVEELNTQDNKRYVIVAIYIDDHFQIYQISLDNDSTKHEPIKSTQKVGRAGVSTRTFLLYYMSNLYLISGYIESDAGKVAIYRWLDLHFSVEDVKDVAVHNEMIVHSSKQLVILILQTAEYPERSITHIYVLNEQRKIVKTQEMYFLYYRLPHYVVDDDMYILRCLASDKCFLYKWNNENLFLRVSKVRFNPRNVELYGAGNDLVALSFDKHLYFYHNEPLLKIASSYAILDTHKAVISNSLYIGNGLHQVYVYQEQTTRKKYLCLLYQNEGFSMQFFEIQLTKRRSAQPDQGEQASFSALKTCLENIKDIVNVRKTWIDLIKYQIQKTLRPCKTQHSSQLPFLAAATYVADTSSLARTVVDGKLDESSNALLQKWNNVRAMIKNLHMESRNLFFKNKVNVLHTNLNVRGKLQAQATKMKTLRVDNARGASSNSRSKRSFEALQNLVAGTVDTNELYFDGKLFANVLQRHKINRIKSPVHIDKLHATKVHLKMDSINRIPLAATFNRKSDKKVILRRKQFKNIVANEVKLSSMNGYRMSPEFDKLRSSSSLQLPTDTVTVSGVHEVHNLIVKKSINGIDLPHLMKSLYFTGSTIEGNVHLRAPARIRNVKTDYINMISTKSFLDLRSNQTVVAEIFMNKVYATELHNRIINEVKLPEDVSFIGKTTQINTAHASNIIVMKDFTLSRDDLQLTRHVLGTQFEDFSQIYSGKVHLKGTLKIQNLIPESGRFQMMLNSLPVVPQVSNRFWMKHVEQEIPSFAFQRRVEMVQLLCDELNYHHVGVYLRRYAWQSLLLRFTDVIVNGSVKLRTNVPSLLHKIHSEAVRRGTLTTVYGQKVFNGVLNVENFAADFIDFIPSTTLVESKTSIFVFQNLDQVKHLNLNECSVRLLRNMSLKKLRDNQFSTIILSSINSNTLQTVPQMVVLDLNAEYLQTNLINEYSVENIIADIRNITSGNMRPKQLQIDRLIVESDVVTTKQILVQHINEIAVHEYFDLLTLKGDRRHARQEIGGSKIIQHHVVLEHPSVFKQLNNMALDYVFNGVLRKYIPQNIIGQWFFKSISSKYITSKQINDVVTKHLLNANYQSIKILGDVSIGTTRISSNVNGYMFPNITSISMPNLKLASYLETKKSVFMKNYHQNSVLYDVLMTGVVDGKENIENEIIFKATKMHFEKVLTEQTILSQTCNFLNLLGDSINKNQAKVFLKSWKTFSRAQMLREIIVEQHADTVTLNGIHLNSLNSSIHYMDGPLTINSKKFFQSRLQVESIECGGQLSNNIKPDHLALLGNLNHQIRSQFGSSVNVFGNFIVETINNEPVNTFFHTRASLHNYEQINPQIFTGILTVGSLILLNDHNTITTINSVPLNDVVLQTSNEHQTISEPIEIRGNLILSGPTSVLRCNKFDVLNIYKASFLLKNDEFGLENLELVRHSTLKQGTVVGNALNRLSIQQIMLLRLSSVEDLLPLVPRIQGHLTSSRRAFLETSSTRPIIYSDYNRTNQSRRTSVTDSKEDKIQKVLYQEGYINGLSMVNVTVMVKTKAENWSSSSTMLKGSLQQIEWKELGSNHEFLVVVAVLNHTNQFLLHIQVFEHGAERARQNIKIQTTASNVALINANNAMLLAVYESALPEHMISVPKVKLYDLDRNTLQFSALKTLSGYISEIVALEIQESLMYAVLERNSTTLPIYQVKNRKSFLYQKLIAKNDISKVQIKYVADTPCILITTADKISIIYVHSSLEGWKEYSYERFDEAN
ncbi:uncharacterized protein LOC129739088 [Uranotaenia lowii]|uniref:uncharacterized protein LOC129739088 n=1 Tax=Uranotaenia lowii TaxID=190385 RepID=UPI00247904F1|nr:uncharacterized protein LOC129739088 [Uranotaenia lowii]